MSTLHPIELKAFVPAKDFELSKQFYRVYLGVGCRWHCVLPPRACELSLAEFLRERAGGAFHDAPPGREYGCVVGKTSRKQHWREARRHHASSCTATLEHARLRADGPLGRVVAYCSKHAGSAPKHASKISKRQTSRRKPCQARAQPLSSRPSVGSVPFQHETCAGELSSVRALPHTRSKRLASTISRGLSGTLSSLWRERCP